MKKLFFGGVHPVDKKSLSCDKELIHLAGPDYVTIPLVQHIGVACRPLVKQGEYVFKGQKIGDGEGLCVPIHASVSGTVTTIAPAPHINGGEVSAIMIKNDYKNVLYKNLSPCPNPDTLNPMELFSLIREAGIIGMGGAAFPTDKKAISAMEKADTMLINACECEPYITADDQMIRTWPEKVIGGIRLLAKALKPERTVLAVEDNKPEAIKILKEKLADDSTIQFKVLPTRYPQGAEKQLVQAVTGRQVPPGRLPVDVSCVVFNVSTAAAVYQAVYEGMPLIERIVSVTGEAVANPGNYYVPIGTRFEDLIETAGGLNKGTDRITAGEPKEGKGKIADEGREEKKYRVIAGGPMMGRAQATLDVPVIKGVGSILCLPVEEESGIKNCIRCGKCVEVCPVKLQPLYLYRYGKAGVKEMLEKYHLTDCIECGCCSYICPGRLPLTEQFRKDKKASREGK